MLPSARFPKRPAEFPQNKFRLLGIPTAPISIPAVFPQHLSPFRWISRTVTLWLLILVMKQIGLLLFAYLLTRFVAPHYVICMSEWGRYRNRDAQSSPVCPVCPLCSLRHWFTVPCAADPVIKPLYIADRDNKSWSHCVRCFGTVYHKPEMHRFETCTSKRYDTRCYFNVRSKTDVSR